MKSPLQECCPSCAGARGRGRRDDSGNGKGASPAPLLPELLWGLTCSEQGSSKHLSIASKPEFGYPKDRAPRPGEGFAVPAIGKRRRRAKDRYPQRARSAAQEGKDGQKLGLPRAASFAA